MQADHTASFLDRPVDPTLDHVLGSDNAEITLIEYGSYACPHCRAANERISDVRDRLGDRLRYVFRHRPLSGNELARRAAELVEHARDPEEFWRAHVQLMTRSPALTDEDLRVVSRQLGLSGRESHGAAQRDEQARERVRIDEQSASRSGVTFTPSFFINARRYDGPWDESSFSDALLGSLGHRMRVAALDFAGWAPSAGLLLILASIAALILTNSASGAMFAGFWGQPWGLTFAGVTLAKPLVEWINEGLLTVFFLVVGLEVKREFTVGRLASRASASLPVAAALGGMAVPAIIYLLCTPPGPWRRGWGIPMETDTAFAIALIAVLGSRVPVSLRVFLTAAAIVDDIVAIVIVAVFYSGALRVAYLSAATGLVGVLWLLNRWRVYHVAPYLMLGLALWLCIYKGGINPTLAGVLLALFIPARPPPNLGGLMAQANLIIESEAERGGEALRHGPSLPALRALDAIHDRLESPADHTLRQLAPRSSYLVLPMFALANAGVVLSTDTVHGRWPLLLAVMFGLVIGKPAGIVLGSALAVRLGLAVKPGDYSWSQLVGAGALAGIGFTMSLFIAEQGLPSADFSSAKIAIFASSLLAAMIGIGILWLSSRAEIAYQRAGALSPLTYGQ